jgi:hypothetical protein
MKTTKLVFLKGGKNITYTTFLSFLMILFFSSSCYKRKDTILEVIVRNANGGVVDGAQVRIFAEPTIAAPNIVTVNKVEYANNFGVAKFDMNALYKSGQTGVAVLKIEAQHLGRFGFNHVTVIEEETVTQTVYIE